MIHDVKLFLSTVTDEFEPRDKANGVAYRSRLRQICDRPNVTVKVQDDFMAAGVPTLDKLDDYIQTCDAVVHLVGDLTGSMAHPAAVASLLKRYPDLAVRLPALRDSLETGLPELSYTQWEAYLAVLHGKTLIIAKAGEAAPRGKTIPLDDPQRVAQQKHLARLETLGRYVEITFADVNDLAAQVANSALLDLLARAHAQPTEKPNNIPLATLGSLFKGREEFLDTVRNKLRHGGHVSAIVGAQAVHGLGGLGKTRAAVEYALRHADEYSALLFVAADRPETLEKSLADLCGPLVLNLPEQDIKEQSVRYAAVVTWLHKHPGWFLILDNVDDEQAARAVEALLPHLRAGHVLITSRFGEWSGSVERLDLEVLTPEASIDFLRERTKGLRKTEPDDGATVAALVQELDGLPLALEQAAAFLVAKQESFAGYLQRWKAHEQKVRTWHDATRMSYPRSIAVTWDTSFEQLTSSSRALLNMLSWYAPEPIPVTVWQTERAEQAIADGAQLLSPGTEPLDAEDARAGLSRYGLLQWQPDRSAFSVHRLVQEVTRERLTPAEETASLQNGLQVLNNYLSADPPPNDVRSWSRWNPARVHAATLIEHADKSGIAEPTSRLMNELGLLLQSKGLWDEAEKLCRRVLAISEQSYGIEHPTVAICLNNLALLLADTNRLAEAEPLMRRALAIDEQSKGAEHPDIASDLNSLTTLLCATNRLAEAEPLIRRALAIDEQSYGAAHPKIAIRLNNLTTLLCGTNRLAEAEPLMRRSLAIDEQFYGAEHPRVAIDLNNLGLLLKDTNRLAEAEPMLRRALAIDEQSYGAKHPDVARNLNNLALLLQDTNRLAEAEPLIRRALDIWRASLGNEHPNTLTVGRNYDLLLAAMAAGGPAKG
ncbi:MAG: tetratricopeptide repeat protein [Planctomycetota bacterium]